MNKNNNKNNNKKKDFAEIYAVIVAAGTGRRMGAEVPKQLLAYGRSTVLGTTVRRFTDNRRIDGVIVVSPQDGSLDDIYIRMLSAVLPAGYTVHMAGDDSRARPSVAIVRGGDERGDSVQAGLAVVWEDTARRGVDPKEVLVLIHDASRPGVTQKIIDCNIDMMSECEAVVTAVKSVDSMRMLSDRSSDVSARDSENSPNSRLLLKESITYPIMNSIVVNRDRVYNVQTPQTFRLSDIMAAYEYARNEGYTGTDDASVAEYAGYRVAIVPGARSNKKITTREDISMVTRVGTGYDVHRLVPGRALILCGTPVPYELGLDGHSDADVAAHALMDALLGAAGLGDIGRLFPDNDDTYKDADSMELLAKVREYIDSADLSGSVNVINADITIIAQAPKLSPYNDQMRAKISETLGIPLTSVNVKATTEEGLGFTGDLSGIAAHAVCLIEKAE